MCLVLFTNNKRNKDKNRNKHNGRNNDNNTITRPPSAPCRRLRSCARATAGAASSKTRAAPAAWSGRSGRHYIISVLINVTIILMIRFMINHNKIMLMIIMNMNDIIIIVICLLIIIVILIIMNIIIIILIIVTIFIVVMIAILAIIVILFIVIIICLILLILSHPGPRGAVLGSLAEGRGQGLLGEDSGPRH